MKVKIFTVLADKSFRLTRAGEETGRLSANEKLEREIQAFLDQSPQVQIKHLQFSSVAVVPKNAQWDTTNTAIDWGIEKSVLIIYDDSA